MQRDMQAFWETAIPNHKEKESSQLVSRTAAAVADREAIDGRRRRHPLGVGMPITDVVQSKSEPFSNLLAFRLPVGSVKRPAAPIRRTRARSLFNKDFISCNSGKQLAPGLGLIPPDLLMQGEVLHNFVA